MFFGLFLSFSHYKIFIEIIIESHAHSLNHRLLLFHNKYDDKIINTHNKLFTIDTVFFAVSRIRRCVQHSIEVLTLQKHYCLTMEKWQRKNKQNRFSLCGVFIHLDFVEKWVKYLLQNKKMLRNKYKWVGRSNVCVYKELYTIHS